MATKQVVVIGLGRFGTAVATTLYTTGHEVLGVDVDRDCVDHLSGKITHAVQADATDEQILRDLGVAGYDAGIVAITTSTAASILATLVLKHLGVGHIVAKAGSVLHTEVLRHVGADRVVFPAREMGIQLAHTISTPQVEDYLEVSADFGLCRLVPPADFFDATLADLHDRSGLTVILVHRGADLLLHPPSDERLRPGDEILVAGPVTVLERLKPVSRPGATRPPGRPAASSRRRLV